MAKSNASVSTRKPLKKRREAEGNQPVQQCDPLELAVRPREGRQDDLGVES
jgi:hypothetical protein